LDLETLFNLLHVRLACLTLINQTALAASESKILGDMTSAFYRHHETNQHVVPWDLRVLAVRLQALGFGEWRRGIMQYYMLATETRQAILAARSEGDRKEVMLWTARLRDLGVRVASVLIEMGDAEAAARHLRTLDLEPGLESADRRRIVGMEALVWFRVGDLRAARRCIYRLRGSPSVPTSPSVEIPSWEHEEVQEQENDFPTKVLSALLKTGEGEFDAAIDEWRALHDAVPEDDMVVQNLAVCLLYTGRLAEARDMLETLLDEDGSPGAFRSLLFNLCTVYELCTERARDLKVSLTERVAQAPPTDAGWEKATVDFKL
jgi:trafficking protein particle complex subunit 12